MESPHLLTPLVFLSTLKRITDLIVSLKIKQLDVVGHSLGGKVAMQLALNQHELISHLVVLDIAPVGYSARHYKCVSRFKQCGFSPISPAENKRI